MMVTLAGLRGVRRDMGRNGGGMGDLLRPSLTQGESNSEQNPVAYLEYI